MPVIWLDVFPLLPGKIVSRAWALELNYIGLDLSFNSCGPWASSLTHLYLSSSFLL